MTTMPKLRPQLMLPGARLGLMIVLLLSLGMLPALPQYSGPTWPDANADLTALARDELSLGLASDPYARMQMPQWQTLIEEWALQVGADRPVPPISQRLPHGFSLTSPIDMVAQHRAPLEFCPGYWPEHHPGNTLGDFCHDDYLHGPWLYDQRSRNPFAVAQQQVRQLNRDRNLARRRIGAALVHWWLGGHDADAAYATVMGALGGEDPLHDGIVAELAVEPLLKLMPDTLWQVVPEAPARTADLRVRSALSHGAVVNMPRMLQQAAARGIEVVVIADDDHVAAAQEATRTAERLKRQGLLPPDFQVMVGQTIRCLGAELTAIGLQRRIASGMTIEKTLQQIHDQGAVAILNRPGRIGGTNLLRSLDVEGYFIQADLFELFRTMSILYDPELADKAALYASHSRYTQGVGLPHSAVLSPTTDRTAMIAALGTGDAFAASNLYFPLMALLVTKPVAAFETTLNRYFGIHERLTEGARQLMGADHVIVTITWDETVRELMGLRHSLREIRSFAHGDSTLRHSPRLSSIAVQYGAFHIEYRRQPEQIWVRSRLNF